LKRIEFDKSYHELEWPHCYKCIQISIYHIYIFTISSARVISSSRQQAASSSNTIIIIIVTSNQLMSNQQPVLLFVWVLRRETKTRPRQLLLWLLLLLARGNSWVARGDIIPSISRLLLLLLDGLVLVRGVLWLLMIERLLLVRLLVLWILLLMLRWIVRVGLLVLEGLLCICWRWSRWWRRQRRKLIRKLLCWRESVLSLCLRLRLCIGLRLAKVLRGHVRLPVLLLLLLLLLEGLLCGRSVLEVRCHSLRSLGGPVGEVSGGHQFSIAGFVSAPLQFLGLLECCLLLVV
jgi:hypothetical protein